jgi:hypothetical protein
LGVSPGASYGFKADPRSKKKINEAIVALDAPNG